MRRAVHPRSQRSLDGLWSQLPSELLERVLPFLPVPDLCRLRAVCKRWDALISTPAFGALCARNASTGAVPGACFAVKLRVHSTRTSGRSTEIPSWSIFDLSARRWYSINNKLSVNGVALTGYDSDVPALDGGLVCTAVDAFTDEQRLASTIDNATHPQALVVCNLVGNTVLKVLPNPPLPRIDLCWVNLRLVVDEISHSFKVFLICVGSFWNHTDPCMCVYESSTDRWRHPRNPPLPRSDVGARVRTAIYRGLLYVLFSASSGAIHGLYCYHVVEDAWDDTAVQFSRLSMLHLCDLVVSDGRLFLMTQRLKGECQVRGKKRTWSWPLDISEISLADRVCRTVARLGRAELGQKFGCKWMRNPHLAPTISTFGFGKSILVLCKEAEKMLRYDLETGQWELLPANPMESLQSGSPSHGSTGSLSRHGKHVNYLRLPSTAWVDNGAAVSNIPQQHRVGAEIECADFANESTGRQDYHIICTS